MKRKVALIAFLVVLMTLTTVFIGCSRAVQETPTPLPQTSKVIRADEGGEVKLTDGTGITIPADVLEENKEVIVQEVADFSPPEDTNLKICSKVYNLSVQDVETFESPVTVTITYNEEEIPPGASESDLQIAFYDDVVAKEWVLLGGEVDTEKNIISLTTSHLSELSVIVPIQPNGFTDLTKDAKDFDIDFLTEGPNAVRDRGYPENVLRAFRYVEEKISGMGFKTPIQQFLGLDSWRVPVKIRDLDKPGKSAYGWYKPGRWRDKDGQIEIDNDKDLDTLKVTIAHEYFHFCQSLYFKDPFGYDPYLWWNEATALWIEDVCYPESDDYITLLDANIRDGIEKPLETNTESHGYGSNAFVRYLTDRFGNGIILEVYQRLQTQRTGSRAATRAIDEVLRTKGITEGLAEAFSDFALRCWTIRDFSEADKWQDPFLVMGSKKLSQGNPQQVLECELGPLSARAYKIVLESGSRGPLLVSVEGQPDLEASMSHTVYAYTGKRVKARMVNLGRDYFHIHPTIDEYWYAELYPDEARIFEGMWAPAPSNVERDMLVLVVVNSDYSLQRTWKAKITVSMPMYMFPIDELKDRLLLSPDDLPDWDVNPAKRLPTKFEPCESPDGRPSAYMWAWGKQHPRGKVIGKMIDPATGKIKYTQEEHPGMDIDILLCTSIEAAERYLAEGFVRFPEPETKEDYYIRELAKGPFYWRVSCHKVYPLETGGVKWSNHAEILSYIESGVDQAASALEPKISAILEEVREEWGPIPLILE